jgi:hypothetical protein
MPVRLDAARRLLTREEIDARLERIQAAVAAASSAQPRAAAGEPVWVSPAELVRRLRPYLVLN